MKKIPVATILLLIIAALMVSDKIRSGYKPGGLDYPGYWAGVRYVSMFGGGDFYSEPGEKRINSFYRDPASGVDSSAASALKMRSPLENVQTPLIYAFLAPLTSGVFLSDKVIFNLAATIFLVAGALLLLRMLRYDVDTSLVLLIFVLYVFDPLLSDYGNNNFSRFMLGFFSLALYSLSIGGRKGRFLTGFILWFGILLKPTIALVPLSLALSRIARRQWSELKVEAAGSMAGVAAGLAIGALYFGYPGVWLDWLSMIKDFSYLNAPFTSLNLSLPSMLNYLTRNDFALPVMALGLLFAGYRVYSLGVLAKSQDGEASFPVDLQAAALGLAAWPLCAKLAWLHYFVLTLPLCLLLLSPSWREAEKWWFTAASLTGFLALTSIPKEPFDRPPIMLVFVLTWGATLVLFLLASRRPYPAGSPKTGGEG